MAVLLDANVLIALLVQDHVHHDAAETWFADSTMPFASCPVTQGSLLRLLIREGYPVVGAQQVLSTVVAHPRHEFWADDVSYADVRLDGVIGHRQVTDAYLAQLARANGGRVVTFDQGLADLHNDVADLIDLSPGRSSRA
jgi:toxin-antitoxin system PIN domain toxin